MPGPFIIQTITLSEYFQAEINPDYPCHSEDRDHGYLWVSRAKAQLIRATLFYLLHHDFQATECLKKILK